MYYVCTKEHLQKALKYVSGIVGRNTTLPILRNILFSIERGKLCLSATDLELGVRAWVRGKIEEGDGKITIPLKQLSEYINNLSPEHIHLKTTSTGLHISSGTSEALFQGEHAENFPPIPELKNGVSWTLSSRDVRMALDTVLYAASLDETRPELSGIFLARRGTHLVFAATDSYRLSEITLPIPEKFPNEMQCILPYRAAQEIRKLIDTDEEVIFSLSENQLLLETSTTQLLSRLIDGVYPDYVQIIPETSSLHIQVSREELLRSLKAVGVFTSRDTQSVLLTIQKDELSLTAQTQEVGETTARLPADVEGEGVSVSFNYRFLLDALSSLFGDEVHLSLTNASVPLILTPNKEKDIHIRSLVMPIKTPSGT